MTIRVAQLGSGYQRKSKSEYVIKQTTVYQGFKVYALQKKKGYLHHMPTGCIYQTSCLSYIYVFSVYNSTFGKNHRLSSSLHLTTLTLIFSPPS